MKTNYLKMLGMLIVIASIFAFSAVFYGCSEVESEDHSNHDHAVQADSQDAHDDHADEIAEHDCDGSGEHDKDTDHAVDVEKHNCADHEGQDEDEDEPGREGHDHGADVEEEPDVNDADTDHEGHDHGEDEEHDGEENEVVLSAESMDLARIETITVDLNSISTVIEVPGTILPHPVSEAFVGSLLEGRIKSLHADIGDVVEAGTPLCVIESPAVGGAEAEYIIALAELEFLKGSAERQESLLKEGIGSKSEYLEIDARLTSAGAVVKAAKTTLYAMGFTESDLQKIKDEKQAAGRLTLRSPVQGRVVEKDARLGMRVTAENNLFHIVDQEHVRIRVDIAEKDAAGIEPGMEVSVYHENGKLCTHQGILERISSQVNQNTRTVPAFITFENPDHCLATNGFVTAKIKKPAGNAIAVPAESILKDEHGDEIVYVMCERGVFTLREVETGDTTNGWVKISEGLMPGEIVVSQGAFAILSESQKSEFSHNCAH